MSNVKTPETPQKEQPQTTEEQRHPKKEHEDHSVPMIHHEHAVIHPVPSEVTHVDPGAVVF